ncbi:MAG: amidohydrolase family protein [Candidatus Latescibacterota bacterium]|nr:amidohydrolase family protein [Candidatus Latescibacterota bacterium]
MTIDTHIHLYNPFRPEGAPWPDPGNELLYRPTLPVHIKSQAIPEGVTGVVVVEASERVEDNGWILDLADNYEPFILGLVGRLEPDDEHFERDLARFAANPIFRGIRFWGRYFVDVEEHGLIDKMSQLARHHLVLDVNFPHDNEEGFSTLSTRVPDLTVVIEHVGQAPVNGERPPEAWIERMRRAAENPRVSMKVSALMEHCSEQPAPAAVDLYRPAFETMWELFGGDRLFFGSNWPVCERAGTYARCLQIARALLAERSESEQAAFFHENAARIYGLSARS